MLKKKKRKEVSPKIISLLLVTLGVSTSKGFLVKHVSWQSGSAQVEN